MDFSSLKKKKTRFWSFCYPLESWHILSGFLLFASALILFMVIITAVAKDFWLNDRLKYMQQNC